jgi:hypothetical protein
MSAANLIAAIFKIRCLRARFRPRGSAPSPDSRSSTAEDTKRHQCPTCRAHDMCSRRSRLTGGRQWLHYSLDTLEWAPDQPVSGSSRPRRRRPPPSARASPLPRGRPKAPRPPPPSAMSARRCTPTARPARSGSRAARQDNALHFIVSRRQGSQANVPR